MASGGIAIAAGIQAAELFGIAAIKVTTSAELKAAEASVSGTPSPWRPVQWNAATDSKAMMYCITVPAAYNSSYGTSSPDGSELPVDENGVARMSVTASTTQSSPETYLVFDGVMRATHSQPARPTQFPVQNAANISDHVLLDNAHLSLDIIMSDAQQAFATGQWVGNASKSISCYLVLSALRAARVPLTVSTRLQTYTNMIILDIVPDETVRTLHGLRARVDFQQIRVATVSTSSGNSAREQTTDSTTTGPTNTTSVPSGVTTQNAVPSAALESSNGYTIPGVSNWSSNNVGDLVGVSA